MKKGIGRILKSNDVKLEGRLQLETLPAPSKTTRLENKSAEPTVAVLERHADFALLEVTCCCGTKMYLRCEYGAGEEKTSESEKPVQAASGTRTKQTVN